MDKILLPNPKEFIAETGDIFEAHFNILSMPLIGKTQRAIIESRINAHKNIKVIETSTPTPGNLVVTFKVVDNPFPLIIAIGGVLAILGAFFVMSSLDRVYKITQDPVGRFAVLGTVIGGILALVALTRILR